MDKRADFDPADGAEANGGSSNGAPLPDGLTENAPGLARLALDVYVNTAGWAFGVSMRTGSRVIRAAARGENPAVLVGEVAGELREGARKLLGIPEGVLPSVPGVPDPDRDERSEDADEHAELRTRGAELLRRSADIRDSQSTDHSHPAYQRILEDIAPDEARILRLLATSGPQPAVDVRTWRPLGIGSTLVAAGLSMIGAESGMRRPERIHANLDNLARLGLIWFPHEPLQDPRVYQVLEAQPEVTDALERAGRGRTERRAISLTSFGADFCDAALPLDPGPRLDSDEAPDADASAGSEDPLGEDAGPAAIG